jgi:hypothetical protein
MKIKEIQMKKNFSLIIAVLIFASGIFITGCSSSDKNKLVDCLELTKSADSMEANLTTRTETNGQAIDIKMNMKAEDIQNDMKSKVDMEVLGKKQEFYLSFSNGNVELYNKDSSGKYSVTSIDASQLNGMDITKSFDSYIEVIQTNPDMVNKKSNNTYELNVPKEKIEEIYSKITGKKMSQSLDNLKIEFAIGDDGFLQKINLKANDIEVNTDYFNYNEKFNIVLPNV